MMAKKQSLAIREVIKSFGHAWNGLLDILKTEHTAMIHAAATVLVILLSCWLRLDAVRFALILLAIVNVWVAESFNTVFEIITDHVSPEFSTMAQRAKDIAAGAVLVSCMGAFALGLILLAPPLIERLKSFG